MTKAEQRAEAERLHGELANLEADVRRLKTNIDPSCESDWRARDEIDAVIMSLHDAKKGIGAVTAFLFYKERRNG